MWRNAALMLGLVLAASAQEQRLQSSTSGARFGISGTVVHAVSGEPLPKVEVAIGPAERPDSVQSMVTTGDGRFRFENLSTGKYWIAAQGKGFSPQRLDQHEQFSTAIAVGPNLQSAGIIFRMYPDGVIAGTVLDEENDPVRQAQVMLFLSGWWNGTTATHAVARAMTDDRGMYRFSGRTPGTYYVAVTAQPWYSENYMSQRMPRSGEDLQRYSESSDHRSEFDVTYPITYYNAATDPNGATAIVLKPGDRVVADFALTPVPALYLRISGIDTSKGVSASLSQHGMGQFPVQISQHMNYVKDGEMEISGIPPGEFDLTVRSWGTKAIVQEKQIDMSDSAQTDLSDTVAPVSITGSVKFDDEKALAGRAIIEFVSKDAGREFGAGISEKGEFETADQAVQPGTYDVYLFNSGEAVVRDISATGAKVTGHEIEIGGGSNVHLEIVLSHGAGRVNGTAVRNGQPVAGAMIVLVPQDLEHNFALVRRDQSDSDGTFSLYNVLPGKYQVIALASGWGMQWRNPSVLQPYLGHSEAVNVVARGKYDIKVDVH